MNIITYYNDLMNQKKAIDAELKKIKPELLKLYSAPGETLDDGAGNGLKWIHKEYLRFNSKQFETDYPDIYELYKTTRVVSDELKTI